ncbi:hypothetical protein DLM78_20295 [Leptospira stimsonii]|uniref:Uncharacterized protein n=1 Tax=Leptospira stimsonii TaxID=2202203 RepID=A0A8B3CK72_9LEPT|nr:hypothetical protein DLM78_20295 [Leptospira stimsonii]
MSQAPFFPEIISRRISYFYNVFFRNNTETPFLSEINPQERMYFRPSAQYEPFVKYGSTSNLPKKQRSGKFGSFQESSDRNIHIS